MRSSVQKITALFVAVIFIFSGCTVKSAINKFENFKWYRKMKGGTWVRYFPRMYPYMIFWTRGELYYHEIECDRDEWGEMKIIDKVAKKEKNRKRKFRID